MNLMCHIETFQNISGLVKNRLTGQTCQFIVRQKREINRSDSESELAISRNGSTRSFTVVRTSFFLDQLAFTL